MLRVFTCSKLQNVQPPIHKNYITLCKTKANEITGIQFLKNECQNTILKIKKSKYLDVRKTNTTNQTSYKETFNRWNVQLNRKCTKSENRMRKHSNLQKLATSINQPSSNAYSKRSFHNFRFFNQLDISQLGKITTSDIQESKVSNGILYT